MMQKLEFFLNKDSPHEGESGDQTYCAVDMSVVPGEFEFRQTKLPLWLHNESRNSVIVYSNCDISPKDEGVSHQPETVCQV